jgi:hypothetical protein
MVAATLAAGAWLATTGIAHAQDPADPGSAQGGAIPASTRELDLAAKRPYWSGSHRRWFLSSVLEGGFFYMRTQMAVGWGRPHWEWVGIEEQTRISGGGGSEYVGLRAALPFVDFRGGARNFFSTDQAFLPPQENYSREDVLEPDTPKSHYLSLEGEVAASFKLLGGSVFGAGTVMHILGVPDGYYVFEDALHVVVDPPWLWRVRLGYVHGLGTYQGLRLGLAGEVIHVPARDALVVRLGPQLAVTLTHHLDAVASIMAVLASPDSLRLYGAEIGQFGLRYRWATGDPFPEFP